MKRIAFLLTLSMGLVGTSALAAVGCGGMLVSVTEQHGNITFDYSTCSVSGKGSITLAVAAGSDRSVEIHNNAVSAGAILNPAGRLWAGRSTKADQVLATLSLPAEITLNGAIDVHFFGVVAVPTIQPTAGIPGTLFTLTDPQGRMQPGDVCLFYEIGTDPALGTQVVDVTISADGTTARGTVPQSLNAGPFAVRCAQTIADASRFTDLEFMVLF